jgi:hypothetical protein
VWDPGGAQRVHRSSFLRSSSEFGRPWLLGPTSRNEPSRPPRCTPAPADERVSLYRLPNDGAQNRGPPCRPACAGGWGSSPGLRHCRYIRSIQEGAGGRRCCCFCMRPRLPLPVRARPQAGPAVTAVPLQRAGGRRLRHLIVQTPEWCSAPCREAWVRARLHTQFSRAADSDNQLIITCPRVTMAMSLFLRGLMSYCRFQPAAIEVP